MGRALGQLTRSGNSGEPRRELRVLNAAGGKTVQFGGKTRGKIPVKLPFSERFDALLDRIRGPDGRVPDGRADFMAATLALLD